MKMTIDPPAAPPQPADRLLARLTALQPIVVEARPPAAAAAHGAPAIDPAQFGPDPYDDDEPVPISRVSRIDDARGGAAGRSERARAAAIGFATGIAVLMPVMLVLGSQAGDWLGPVWQSDPTPSHVAPAAGGVSASAAGEDRTRASPLRQRSVTTTLVGSFQQLETQEPAPERAAPPPSAPSPSALPTPDTASGAAAPAAALLKAQGLQSIEAGDIGAARELLGRAAVGGDSEALLALAETFDPNMLAAWGARGTRPDVGMARSLYAQALAAGYARARLRLDALE
jgi:hypothetical protein